MTGKLTPSVDKSIIAKAKKLAAARGTTVSALFSQLTMALDSQSRPGISPGPITRGLLG